MRRRLTEEGKSYTKLVDEAFMSIAKSRLSDARCTIAEASADLGFSDKTAFHRAFKRWTGLTPVQYREQQRTTTSLHA